MLVSLASTGQDIVPPQKSAHAKQISFAINISSDYSYRTLKNDDGSAISSIIIDSRNKYEEPKFGYTAGLNIHYALFKHLSFEAGLQYSNKGYGIKKMELTYGDMIDPRFGFVYPTNSAEMVTHVKSIYTNAYLDVPVRAIFTFGNKRIHFISSIGVTTNILLESKHTNIKEYENGDKKRETYTDHNDFNKINITPTASLVINYMVSDKINISAEPTFRYGLLKITDTPVTYYLWNCGLNISIYYVLK